MKILILLSLVLASLFADYSEFKQKCEKIKCVWSADISNYANKNEAIKNTKHDAISTMTKEFNGVVVDTIDKNKLDEEVIQGKSHLKDVYDYSSTITSKGFMFYEFKKYPDEDGDMVEYKQKTNSIKVKATLDCSRFVYQKIQNYKLKQELMQ